MRYAVARLVRERKDHLYRLYISDSLRATTGASERYADWIDPKPLKPQRTREETVASIGQKLDSLWEEDS